MAYFRHPVVKLERRGSRFMANRPRTLRDSRCNCKSAWRARLRTRSATT